MIFIVRIQVPDFQKMETLKNPTKCFLDIHSKNSARKVIPLTTIHNTQKKYTTRNSSVLNFLQNASLAFESYMLLLEPPLRFFFVESAC